MRNGQLKGEDPAVSSLSGSRPRVVIIGGGPAGLMAATRLKDWAHVIVVDQKNAVGRKFLVAGDGGFNLTHSESLELFLEKYDSEFVRSCVRKFTPEHTRKWLKEIGIDTFTGSSGKVFPVEGIKPVQVLNAWLKALTSAKVEFRLKTKLTDFNDTSVRISGPEGGEELVFDHLIFAMGGASWKKTGSDGKWLDLFSTKNVPVLPFRASNSGLELENTSWIGKLEGTQIKNIRVHFGQSAVAGDLTITRYGLEGKPAYAANNWLRNNNFKGVRIDFKPQFSEEEIVKGLRLASTVRKAFQSMKIPGSVYSWLKESLSKEEFTNHDLLAGKIKSFEPLISGFRPIDEVISVVGGTDLGAIDGTGKLKGFRNAWCCGEMLNWDAPTGGYLLQGCFSTGFVVGENIYKSEK